MYEERTEPDFVFFNKPYPELTRRSFHVAIQALMGFLFITPYIF